MQKATIVLFGASSGIGLETARLIAAMPVMLAIVCRTGASAEKTRSQLLAENPNADIHAFACNLELQSEVHQLNEKILSTFAAIDVCIFNAATITGTREFTAENIPVQLAVNHLSAFISAEALLPLFQHSGKCRLIFLSSRVFSIGNLDAKMLWGKRSWYHPTVAYAESKLINVVYSNYLIAKLLPFNIQVFTISPGTVKTGIGNKHASRFQSLLWNLMKALGRKPEDVAKEVVALAMVDSYKAQPDTIWQHLKPQKLPRSVTANEGVQKVLKLSRNWLKAQ